jgi:MoxR-like ATPase
LYHWIDFPDPARAVEILRRTVPTANERLILSAIDFVGRIRDLDLDKPPGMAEAIDWVSALTLLGASELGRADIMLTLGAITKTPDDRDTVTGELDALGYEAATAT